MMEMEVDLKAAFAARPFEPGPGFEARTAAGVHARWRRRTRKMRNACALALGATTLCFVVARAGIFRPPPAPAPAKTPACDARSLTEDLIDFASVDEALEVRADWDRALEPLASYRALADLGDLP